MSGDRFQESNDLYARAAVIPDRPKPKTATRRFSKPGTGIIPRSLFRHPRA